jgi:hypothetical protein
LRHEPFDFKASVFLLFAETTGSDEFQQSLGMRRPLSLCYPTSTLDGISAVEAVIAL